MDVKAPLRRFDEFQQRVPALALPLGVVKKFGDDEGGSMVSLIAYRAFFSLFPLLLLMTTTSATSWPATKNCARKSSTRRSPSSRSSATS